MLVQLKQFDAERLQMEELITLSAFARSLRAEYERCMVTVPEWLDDRARVLSRAIESRRKDALEMRLKEIRAQKATLMTPSEKREALAAEEATLQAELAKA